MELFDKNGHITHDGFRALQDGELDELQSLELAEHLSFCDECLLQYTIELDKTPLLAPPKPLQPTIMGRIKQKATRIFFSKFVKIAAVACFAAVLSYSGMFSHLVPEQYHPEAAQQPAVVVEQTPGAALETNTKPRQWQENLRNFQCSLNGLLESIRHSPVPEPETQLSERERREEVFRLKEKNQTQTVTKQENEDSQKEQTQKE